MPSILGICKTELDVDARKLSRKRRAPTKIKEFFGGKAVLESTNDVISDYSRIYFESLDCIINAIEDRFDQEDLEHTSNSKFFVESNQRRCLHPRVQWCYGNIQQRLRCK